MSEERHSTVPPAGEEVHMPASSILPLINAASLALTIVSITLSWYLVGVGGFFFVITTIAWISSTRRDIQDLPLEHHH
jgi:lipid-A-disaccharide synthase-like uncharacterized protein